MPDPNTYLSRIPELVKGRRFPSMPPEVADEMLAELLAKPNAVTIAIIDTLSEIDDGSDWKSRFLLKALVSQSQDASRAKVQQAFTEALNTDRPASVKTFLVMQLQWIADKDAIDVLTAQLDSDDAALVDAEPRPYRHRQTRHKALKQANKNAKGTPKSPSRTRSNKSAEIQADDDRIRKRKWAY